MQRRHCSSSEASQVCILSTRLFWSFSSSRMITSVSFSDRCIHTVYYNCCCSEKGELKAAAAAKVRQLTAELAGARENGAVKVVSGSVERIRAGFEHFKKEKYEYELSLNYLHDFIHLFYKIKSTLQNILDFL